MHKVELPMAVLDAAKEYTVVYKKMIESVPYFSTGEPERELTVSMRDSLGDHAGPLSRRDRLQAHIR